MRLFVIFFDAIKKPIYFPYLGDQTIEVAFPISMSFLKIERLLKTKSGNIHGVSNFYDCIVLINNNRLYKNIKIKEYAKALKKNGALFDYWSLLKKKKAEISKINKKIKYFQL